MSKILLVEDNLLAYGWPYRGIPIQHWINNRFFQAYALCGFNEVP